jgi:hypothetical protein
MKIIENEENIKIKVLKYRNFFFKYFLIYFEFDKRLIFEEI